MSSPLHPLARVTAILIAITTAGATAAAPRASASIASRRVAPLRVVTQQPAPPAADRPAASESEEGGIFGPLRIGPLVGASIPRPVSIELFLKYKKALGLGLEYSALPSLNVDGVGLHASAIAGDLRWFVLDSPFFLGAGLGVQTLHGAASVDGFSGYADASKVFFTPRLGLLFTFGPGFSVGADAGVELVVSHNETIVPALDQITQNPLLVALTRGPLPDVHLVRLGWLF